jgi:hypothetical protein
MGKVVCAVNAGEGILEVPLSKYSELSKRADTRNGNRYSYGLNGRLGENKL